MRLSLWAYEVLLSFVVRYQILGECNIYWVFALYIYLCIHVAFTTRMFRSFLLFLLTEM